MEKVRNFLKEIKGSWKSIKFISKKTAIKRTALVLVIMLLLGFIILTIDYLVGNGFKALSLISFNINIIKIIFTVVFSISALVLIIFGTLIKSETKSFITPTNNNYDKKKNNPQRKMSKIILTCSIICFVSAIGAYIFQ